MFVSDPDSAVKLAIVGISSIIFAVANFVHVSRTLPAAQRKKQAFAPAPQQQANLAGPASFF